ncbi:MAG: hypothetical protein WBB29_07025 [Geitlerinemataceae cyanobacterium]
MRGETLELSGAIADRSFRSPKARPLNSFQMEGAIDGYLILLPT